LRRLFLTPVCQVVTLIPVVLHCGIPLAENVSVNPSSPDTSRRGLVELYTGAGKGKTSAAIGVVVRALGNGLRVYIAFFMKGATPSGERHILTSLPGIRVQSFGTAGFINPDNIQPMARKKAGEGLAAARGAMLSGDFDLVVLDELALAATWGLVSIDDVLALMADKPESVELVLTGRLADARLVKAADLVTEMVKIKHPYDKGVQARQGIEY
jgi:cob(I)alamin adenosyltransferase